MTAQEIYDELEYLVLFTAAPCKLGDVVEEDDWSDHTFIPEGCKLVIQSEATPEEASTFARRAFGYYSPASWVRHHYKVVAE